MVDGTPADLPHHHRDRRGGGEPQNFEALMGTPMAYLLDKAGYRPGENNRLIMGGPMMGFTVPDPQVPIVKTTNCLLAPSAGELPAPPPAQACIRCGMCAEACPASLLPQQMFWFAQGKEFEKLEQHNLFDCIECGACSWVCPSNIPLVQYYRASKAEILQLRAEHEKSEHSRARFEARQERLEREEAEKEAKRAGPQGRPPRNGPTAKAASGEGDEDPIQAAIERAKAKKAAQEAAGSGPASWKNWKKPWPAPANAWTPPPASWSRPGPRARTWWTPCRPGWTKPRPSWSAEQALADYQRRPLRRRHRDGAGGPAGCRPGGDRRRPWRHARPRQP